MATESTKWPFVTEVILLAILILDKFIIFLIDWVIGEMHVLVVLVDLGGVGLTCEPSQAFLENIDSEWLVTGNKYINSKIKFMTVNK